VSTRWRLFLSYLAVIVALVIVLSVLVRSLAVRSVNAHMSGMMGMGGGPNGMMTGDLQRAVTAGVNEAILWGALAAVIVAVVASYLVSGWITRPLGRGCRSYLRRRLPAAGLIRGGRRDRPVRHGLQ
jgi:hypothetical protein